MKNLPKIFKIFFLTIFVLQLIGFIVMLVVPMAGQAAEVKFNPQISIPNSTTFTAGKETTISGSSIAQYIQAVYKYAIGIVGILATVVMMYGGFMYLMAGGDNGKIGEAKEWIKASITGLLIALSSFMILNTVNPNLVNLKAITVPEIDGPGCCTVGTATSSDVEASCKAKTGFRSWNKGACPGVITTSCSPEGATVNNASECCSGLTSGMGTVVSPRKCITSTDCTGKSWGFDCKTSIGLDGNCYNDSCIRGDGQNGDPCGKHNNAYCIGNLTCAGSGYSYSLAGRGCAIGVSCCYPNQ